MKNKHVALLFAIGLAFLAVWVARNTYWDEVDFPTAPRGEAARNPFYATQHFAEELGARTAWDRVLTVPSSSSVIVLSSWNWNVNQTRRSALERWVESGGRLVIDSELTGDAADFEEWSGIVREYSDEDESADADAESGRARRSVAAPLSSAEGAEGRFDRRSSILALRLRRRVLPQHRTDRRVDPVL